MLHYVPDMPWLKLPFSILAGSARAPLDMRSVLTDQEGAVVEDDEGQDQTRSIQEIKCLHHEKHGGQHYVDVMHSHPHRVERPLAQALGYAVSVRMTCARVLPPDLQALFHICQHESAQSGSSSP